MYTLLELESKTFGELKKIGYELNVLPEGDRRRRQSWIDALVNVNPPLLQLLEVSPAAPVEQVQEPIIETVDASPGVEADQRQEPPIESKFGRIVYPRPDQGSISQVAKTSPGVEVEQALGAISQVAKNLPAVESVELTQKAQDHKFLLCLKDGDNTLWYDGKDFVFEKWSAKTYCRRGVGAAKHQLRFHPEVKGAGNVLQVVENSPRVEVKPIEVQAQEPIEYGRITGYLCRPKSTAKPIAQEVIAQVAETSPCVDLDDELPECSTCFGDGYVEDEFGFVKFCLCETGPKLSRQKTQSAIAPVTKNLPGSRSKTSTAHQLLELFKSSAHIIEDAPGVKTEETVSESAIVPAVEKLPRSEPDPNPILTGIPLSDRFVARYSPPQPENIHFKADTDGQLNLLDF